MYYVNVFRTLASRWNKEKFRCLDGGFLYYVSTTGTLSSCGCGKGSWTPRRQGTAWIQLLTYKKYSFSKAEIVSFYALSVQFSVLVSCRDQKSGNRLHKRA